MIRHLLFSPFGWVTQYIQASDGAVTVVGPRRRDAIFDKANGGREKTPPSHNGSTFCVFSWVQLKPNATFYIHWILISQLWACLSAFNLIQIRNWLGTTRIQNDIRIVRAHQAISATNTQTRNSYVFWSGINIHPPMVRLGRWWCGNRMWK